ncbi:anthranilate phosphoribosyltransferase [Planomicrobium sp. YIM 101495]|uniref:anthranilate phosphoribosyltransferase n=1 Tax=Planomicrobium sp. YIM 101495 TaxID=2665160 RepID=UPI0012B6EEC9|nr:anthranilate phosphoribosyltransferase [Planomicrobium sp. YIM 101495]MTD31530.1 anthranilate phosphoribosyltransferase [Planomicrobium sp. YIM 101495]
MRNFTEQEMMGRALQMLEGKMVKEEMVELLKMLHAKGETADEVVGFVKAMRQKAVQFPALPQALADICGTGGDRSNSFNISTLTAFVLASVGVPVVKHGNRSVSSKTGSSDVLERLNIPIGAEPEELPHLLDQSGLVFLHAPAVHPALGPLREVRKAIETPTIFNLAGPLANPLPIAYQMTGVYAEQLLKPAAEALVRLGRKRGAVVHGAGGLDELTLAGTNQLMVFDETGVRHMTLHPEEVGLQTAPIEAIRGGEPEQNAEIFQRVLAGEHGAYVDTIALNAGAFLHVSGAATTFAEGVAQAKDAIVSGQTAKTFEIHRLAAGVLV